MEFYSAETFTYFSYKLPSRLFAFCGYVIDFEHLNLLDVMLFYPIITNTGIFFSPDYVFKRLVLIVIAYPSAHKTISSLRTKLVPSPLCSRCRGPA